MLVFTFSLFVYLEQAISFSFGFTEFLGIDAKPYTFPYAELRAGTDDFNPSNKLGEGGFGPVYKVTLFIFKMNSPYIHSSVT